MLLCMLYCGGLVVVHVTDDYSMTVRRVNVSCLTITTVILVKKIVTKRWSVVYYETIKRKLNKRLIYECRCDTRLKDNVERSTRLTYTVLNGARITLNLDVSTIVSQTSSK